MSKFSEMLIYLRKRAGLSQQELADKIQMSRSVIGMYESDQRMPSYDALEAIADTFNVNIDLLVGHVDSGESSCTFIDNLAHIIETSNKEDLLAAGVDLYEVNLVISRAIPLTFDHACQLADQLGETLDSMMGIEKPTNTVGELDELNEVFTALSPDNRAKLLELSRLYLSAQNNTKENA